MPDAAGAGGHRRDVAAEPPSEVGARAKIDAVAVAVAVAATATAADAVVGIGAGAEVEVAIQDPASLPEAREQLDDTIRCRRCQHGITAGRYAIEVDGAHTHTFRNPAGWSFQLGCFADAPGAAPTGEATYAHTWFSGYAWRFAHCGGCGSHLGWWFVGGADAFGGLVLSRLM